MNKLIQADNTPFFIIGSGRSGSTLLRLILANHSKITIPPETHYIIDLVENLPMDSALSTEMCDQAVEIMTQHYRWPDLKIDKKNFVEQVSKIKHPYLRDVINLVYELYLKSEGKQRWGDKTPLYINILPEINTLYPKAKYIHLVRDGHDVTLSFLKTRWHSRWLYNNTREWKTAVNTYLKETDQINSNQIMNVRYEDMVANTESVIQKICVFLGESYEPTMLSWTDSITDKVPTRELHAHKKLFKKPGVEDIFLWKKQLGWFDCLIIESFLFNELKMMNYECFYKSIFWLPVFYSIRFTFNAFNQMLMLQDKIKQIFTGNK